MPSNLTDTGSPVSLGAAVAIVVAMGGSGGRGGSPPQAISTSEHSAREERRIDQTERADDEHAAQFDDDRDK